MNSSQSRLLLLMWIRTTQLRCVSIRLLLLLLRLLLLCNGLHTIIGCIGLTTLRVCLLLIQMLLL